jgi:hypothetical protein
MRHTTDRLIHESNPGLNLLCYWHFQTHHRIIFSSHPFGSFKAENQNVHEEEENETHHTKSESTNVWIKKEAYIFLIHRYA